MSYGYANRILRIDLSKGNVVKEPLDPALKREYIGGMGIGIKILYDELKPGTEPFSPDNLLIFATGPLNGTLAPRSGRIDITTRSPLTGMLGTASSGGFWGPELKYAGWDALVVKGKAANPVYIWIDNDNVEIKDASHLWGKDTWDSIDLIKKEFPNSYPDRTSILAIGPAGENLVRFALVICDYHHAAGRSGIGAVMGSKNLKAIVVRGDKGIAIAQSEEFEETIRDYLSRRVIYAMSRTSLDTLRDRFLYTGDLPGRHYQSGVLPDWETRTTKVAKKYLIPTRHACHTCEQGHYCIEVKTGKYAGLKLTMLHLWHYLGFGALCAVDNLPAIWQCDHLCNRLGMDIGDASNTVAFAMELYQRGIISKETTDGLDLEWGNEDAVISMLYKIARREGFGDTLAEGSARAAQKIGRGAEKYAVHIGGMSPYPIDPRPAEMGGRSWMLSTLTSPRGGDNVKTAHQSGHYERRLPPTWPKELGMTNDELSKWYVDSIDLPEDTKQQLYGTPPRLDPSSFKGKPSLMLYLDNRCAALSALGICFLRDISIAEGAKLLSLCTGQEMSEADLTKVAERIFALQWAYNIREGITPMDLDWPERFYKEGVASGPAKGAVLSREAISQALDEYCELRGWDKKTRLPTREKLEELDLKDVADELERLGAIKTGEGAVKQRAKGRSRGRVA